MVSARVRWSMADSTFAAQPFGCVTQSHRCPVRLAVAASGAVRRSPDTPLLCWSAPEGQIRRLIAQQFQVSGQNDFALLDHIGGECAGAVTFLEPGQALLVPIRNGVQRLSKQMGNRAAMIERHYSKLTATMAANKLA